MFNENSEKTELIHGRPLSLLVAVSTLDFLSLEEKFSLLKSVHSIEGLFALKWEDLLLLSGRAMRAMERLSLATRDWESGETMRLARASLSRLTLFKIDCAFYGEKNYPALLSEISDPPFSLFYRGNLSVLENPCVSVVGTRRITGDGKRAAHDFSFDAATAGLCVVSGLAAGADGQAHMGAIDAFLQNPKCGVKTAAVLAGGIDIITPAFHKGMALKIIRGGGCVLSEYPPAVPPEKWRFVRRNRIIAGLSAETIVVQAPPGSGSLITADFALDYNRDLFFHKACFSKSAQAVSKMVGQNLSLFLQGAAQKKIEKTPQSYVRDGAQIIESFSDFVAKRNY